MNEDKQRKDMDRGVRAEVLMRDPLIQEAFVTLEKEFVAAWKQTSVTDSETRENLYQLLQALDAFKGHFVRLIEDGHIAKDKLGIKD